MGQWLDFDPSAPPEWGLKCMVWKTYKTSSSTTSEGQQASGIAL